MDAAAFLSVLSGAAVGLMLGLIGGGGSILATPALLYVVGVADAHVAIGTSALAVSVNAFANFLNHARRGNVKWPCALTFGGAGVLGAAVGAAFGKLTDAHILLPLFALMMIAIGVRMLRPGAGAGDPDVHLNLDNAPKLIGAGLLVGAISGFFGIGGGFLIVPGLMAASGMTMLNAIGSSLFAVGAFGAATATSYAFDGLIDWPVAGLFIAGGVIGGLAGAQLSTRLASSKGVLQRIFAIVVFAVAAYMLWRSWGG
ncbi:MAG: sulfite exporter TauE/SafE family protein [Hyphomonadaceae bacterium]|nr:sulfite exporter TauE/SafE family protein [Hyphomonadaceae bacterium]